MKPEEAIDILAGENKYPWNRGNSPLREAVKLGIEALKRVQDMRVSPCTTADELLPGETEE